MDLAFMTPPVTPDACRRIVCARAGTRVQMDSIQWRLIFWVCPQGAYCPKDDSEYPAQSAHATCSPEEAWPLKS
jgi:hypothetical protein